MPAGETTELDNYGFAELATAGFHLAVRVGFAFPEFEHNTLPRAWIHRYTRDGLMLYDPVIRWIYENTGAARWSEIELSDPRGVLLSAAEHDLAFGAAVCIHDSEQVGLRTFGSFARSDREFTEDEISSLKSQLCALHRASSPPDDLTFNELETLRLIKGGLLMKEVAFELGITESAVKQRLRNAKTKLEARTTAQAVTRATQFGLI
ncbi:MAG: autoinducer binding domain-containing protein [Pseudomonadota bacterium]